MIRVLPGVACRLGEGLLWDPSVDRLWMTDIVAQQILEIDLDHGDRRVCAMPEPSAWVLPTTSPGRYAVGLRSGIALLDIRRPKELTWIERSFPGDPRCRLNDACVDRAGRIWYGSMPSDTDSGAPGRLASFARDRGTTIHDSGFGVTNGPLIAADDRHLYANDSLRGIVYRYAFSLAAGSASQREVFKHFDAADGHPDGMCFDINGNLWLAMWGAARVLQISPDGTIVRSIELPAPNLTNVCFCGPRLDRLIVSSASVDMSAESRARYPDAGRLFEVLDHGTHGLAPWRIAID